MWFLTERMEKRAEIGELLLGLEHMTVEVDGTRQRGRHRITWCQGEYEEFRHVPRRCIVSKLMEKEYQRNNWQLKPC